jgi:hypothetical protein
MDGGGNGYDRATLEGLLTEVDAADQELSSLQGAYMADCKAPRARIKDVKKRAKEAGIPRAAFNALIENRRLDRQMTRNVDKLEDDQRAEYDKLLTDLGDFVDLPLGRAAADRARPASDATLDSLAH